MIKSNYFKIPNEIKTNRELSANEKLTLMILYSYADNEKLTCFPSYETLADDCGLCSRTIMRVVKTLQEKSFITKLIRKKNGEYISNLYKLNTENINKIPCDSQSPGYDTESLGCDLQSQGVMTQSHNNNTNKELDSLNKTNTTTEVVVIEELKTKIESIIQSPISYKSITNLLSHSDKDRINYYLENWHKFSNTNMKNVTGFFIKCIKENWDIPKENLDLNRKGQKNYQIPQHHNFEQREYSDEEFDNFFVKFDKNH